MVSPFSLSTLSHIPPPAILRSSSPRRSLNGRISLKVASVSADYASPKVVVTRELGKNGTLINALETRGIDCLELPLIEHNQLPDFHKLSSILRSTSFDWIIITSPEAGVTFLDAWNSSFPENTICHIAFSSRQCIINISSYTCSSKLNHPFYGCRTPKVRVGVVGAGTARIFEKIVPSSKQSLNVAFVPSKATGTVLAAELPNQGNARSSVLYPASAKASNEIDEGLAKRGFEVTRLNTYTMEPISHVDQMVLEEALTAPVIAVASPSAVRAWVSLLPESQKWDNAAVCIGETTALAARKLGLRNVYFPSNPGLEGWVNSILEALQVNNQLHKV
ncbi:hypothetical protein ABFX02_14G256700 [Erythranthe guttata]